MLELVTIAKNFRTAIENAKRDGESGKFFRKFPTGQCGSTTDILIQYLLDCGYQKLFYVNGTYYGDEWDNHWSHTWLEIDDVIVDITGDQFKNRPLPLTYDIPVYVGPIDAWHKLFDIKHGSYYLHCGLDKSWFNYYELVDWYRIICKYL